MRSTGHTKSRLKKSPTSSVVDGPPIFMKTIAVGPLDPAEFCVTGGVCIVARHLALWVVTLGRSSGDAPEAVRNMPLESIVADCRNAIMTMNQCLLIYEGLSIAIGVRNDAKSKVKKLSSVSSM